MISDCENSIQNESICDEKLLYESKQDSQSVQSLNTVNYNNFEKKQNDSEKVFCSNPQGDDPTLDDVVAQFSSGPLAEFAHKMADNLQNGSQKDEKAVFPELPSGDTGVSGSGNAEVNNSGATPDSYVESENQYEEKTTILPQKEKRNQQKNQSEKRKIPAFVSIIVVLLLLICSMLVLFHVFYNKGQDIVVETEQEIFESVEINALEETFFLKKYQFEDARYKGIINFKLPVNHNYGRYEQSVQDKESDRIFSVKGSFTFSENTITFRPDSYSKDIVWELEEYDPSENSAIFYDPSEQNRETARIYLNIKE